MMKTTLMVQIMIFVLCLAHMYYMKVPLIVTLMFLVVMELGAIAGMWKAARIRKRAMGLPLQRG
jgi:hypothetical protein